MPGPLPTGRAPERRTSLRPRESGFLRGRWRPGCHRRNQPGIRCLAQGTPVRGPRASLSACLRGGQTALRAKGVSGGRMTLVAPRQRGASVRIRCIIECIADRRETPFGLNLSENPVLHLQFSMSGDWRNFPQTTIHFRHSFTAGYCRLCSTHL